MTGFCPNCKAPLPEGAADCAACGIVIAKFLKKQAAPASPTAGAPAGSEPSPSSEKGGSGGLIAAAAIIAGLGAGGWFMYPGKGMPVTDTMQKSKGHAFAASAPAGFKADWTERTTGIVAAQFANTTVASLQGTFTEGYAPNMAIVSMPFPPVKVTPGNKDKLAETRFAGIRASVDTWTPEAVQIVKVDKLESLRVEGGGPKHVKRDIPPVTMNGPAAIAYMKQKTGQQDGVFFLKKVIDMGRVGPTPDAYIVEEGRTEEADYELLSGGVLVPGRNRQYLLSYVCDRNQRTACVAAFDELVGSFRVLERPRPLDFMKSKGCPPRP
jgi:hypothetical protein